MSIVVGVEIGGSHITTALVDLEKQQILEESKRRKFINSQADAGSILKAWSEIIRSLWDSFPQKVERIGIAIPGPFNYEDGISLILDQDKFNSLFNLNVKRELSNILGIPPGNIKFTNDAASFLQGELFCGAVQNQDGVLGLTLGTGLGSAYSIQGIAYDAGLWNSSFKEGIAEDYLSTRWFIKRYKELSGITVSGVREMLETDDLISIQKVFEEFGKTLGLFLIPQIENKKYKAIVFGGNISNASDYFFPFLKEFLNSHNINLPLRVSILQEEAALIGAASLWDKAGTLA